MAETRRSKFISAIKKEYIVEIYFAVGKSGGGNNEIVYKAKVIDIRTDTDGINSPDKYLTPIEWRKDKNKIWIKIENIVPCKKLTTKDFIVAITGNVLSDSISNSQYHFGYIKKRV